MSERASPVSSFTRSRPRQSPSPGSFQVLHAIGPLAPPAIRDQLAATSCCPNAVSRSAADVLVVAVASDDRPSLPPPPPLPRITTPARARNGRSLLGPVIG